MTSALVTEIFLIYNIVSYLKVIFDYNVRHWRTFRSDFRQVHVLVCVILWTKDSKKKIIKLLKGIQKVNEALTTHQNALHSYILFFELFNLNLLNVFLYEIDDFLKFIIVKSMCTYTLINSHSFNYLYEFSSYSQWKINIINFYYYFLFAHYFSTFPIYARTRLLN